MKIGFKNHWGCSHIIILGMDRGFAFRRRYLEFTFMNCGVQIAWMKS